MTVGEIAQIITAIILVGGFFLSMRSTSFTELKTLYEKLKQDFEDYREESRAKEDEYKRQIDDLESTVDKFKKYISRLIRQLEKNGITPEKFEETE